MPANRHSNWFAFENSRFRSTHGPSAVDLFRPSDARWLALQRRSGLDQPQSKGSRIAPQWIQDPDPAPQHRTRFNRFRFGGEIGSSTDRSGYRPNVCPGKRGLLMAGFKWPEMKLSSAATETVRRCRDDAARMATCVRYADFDPKTTAWTFPVVCKFMAIAWHDESQPLQAPNPKTQTKHPSCTNSAPPTRVAIVAVNACLPIPSSRLRPGPDRRRN